jgi:hypothetical protein
MGASEEEASVVHQQGGKCGTWREEVSAVHRQEEGGADRGGESWEVGTGEVSLGRRRR